MQFNEQGRPPEEFSQEGGVKGAQEDDVKVVKGDGGRVREGLAPVGGAAATKLIASVYRNTPNRKKGSL